MVSPSKLWIILYFPLNLVARITLRVCRFVKRQTVTLLVVFNLVECL